jgi:hypothetical protein
MAKKCHCLTHESVRFYVCCGWYCDECGGRVEDMKKMNAAREHHYFDKRSFG